MHFISSCDLTDMYSKNTDAKLLIVSKKTSSYDNFFIKLYMHQQGFHDFKIFDENTPLSSHDHTKRFFIFSSYKTHLWEHAASLIHPTHIVGGGLNYHPKIRSFHLGNTINKWIITRETDIHESRARLKTMLTSIYPLYDGNTNVEIPYNQQYHRVLAPKRLNIVPDDVSLSYSYVKDVRALDLINISLFSLLIPIIGLKYAKDYDLCLVGLMYLYKLYVYHQQYENEKYNSTYIEFCFWYITDRIVLTVALNHGYKQSLIYGFSFLYCKMLTVLGGNRQLTEYREPYYILCKSLSYIVFSVIVYIWIISKIY